MNYRKCTEYAYKAIEQDPELIQKLEKCLKRVNKDKDIQVLICICKFIA